MIQRIQSIFLFLASAAGLGQFALPYASTDDGGPVAEAPVLADGVFNPFDNIGLLGLLALSALISLIAIFMFRNRILQGRLTGMAALVTVLLILLLGFVLSQTMNSLPSGETLRYQAGLVMPVLALVMQWLAGRYIKKDEALVRSADRLR
jgi:hypothetical protein